MCSEWRLMFRVLYTDGVSNSWLTVEFAHAITPLMEQEPIKWTYRRINHKLGLETSEWLGSGSPSLSAHFHDEIQISVVQDGHRVFRIGRQCIHVPAGQFVIIPAATPHRSHGQNSTLTKSRDIFLDPACALIEHQSSVLTGSVSDRYNNDDGVSIEDVLHKISSNKVSELKLHLQSSLSDDLIEAISDGDIPVAKLARFSSLSREGFIRRFAREIGMTPHAYRLATRATQARSLLRRCLTPAAVAHECGFADQSHLGRVFKRNFGTSPGVYRKAWQP